MIKFTPGRNEDEKEFDEDMLQMLTDKYPHTNADFSHLDNELQILFIQYASRSGRKDRQIRNPK